MSFDKMFTNWDILDYLKENKFKNPTEIQQKAIPLLIKGKSLAAAAQTGTGKTLAYALPAINLVKKLEEKEGINEENGAPLVVILSPTRELARQVQGVIKGITHNAKCKVRLLASGESSKKTVSATHGPVDILITVPGKLHQSLKKGDIAGNNVRMLILDEADQLLDAGFSKEIAAIKSFMLEPQIALFSATIPLKFDEFRKSVFPDVQFDTLLLKGTHKVQQNIETYNVYLAYTEKPKFTVEYIKKVGKGQGIIFLNQKEHAETLYKFLLEEFPKRKFHLLHGGMTPQDRKKSYRKFVEEKGILISTDISARGIDIEGLSWVLNYDLPFDSVYYIHRVGRTGRQGKDGIAYNFVTAKDEKLIAKINAAILEQDTLKIKPLELLKKNRAGASSPKNAPAKKAAGKHKAKRVKKSPGFARKKKR